jgi:hypothetical protein
MVAPAAPRMAGQVMPPIQAGLWGGQVTTADCWAETGQPSVRGPADVVGTKPVPRELPKIAKNEESNVMVVQPPKVRPPIVPHGPGDYMADLIINKRHATKDQEKP